MFKNISKCFFRYHNVNLKATRFMDTRNKSCAVDLSYTEFAPSSLHTSRKPIIILHGLLGSKVNWKSLAKVIASRCGRLVYTLDARNHGESPHTEDFNYSLMAEDVKVFAKKKKLSNFVLIGHSMGGRTVMTIALSQPEMIEKLIVVDVSPSNMPGGSIISKYMSTMKEVLNILPANCSLTQARVIANDYMAKSIPELSIRFFLLNNLMLEAGKFAWKANVEVLDKHFSSSIMKYSPPSGIYNGKTLFICGGDSNYVSPDDHPSIRKLFPNAEFLYIPGAGHWVHSEKPKEFLSAVEDFCRS